LNISVFGLGYVGCVSLSCLAKMGHQVIGVDSNHLKVNAVNKGEPTIIEKEIDTIMYEQFKLGKISATIDSTYAVQNSDISFVCVGTPSTPNGHLDLSSLFKVAEEIGEGIKSKNSFHVIIIRSTVFPGTNQKVSEIIEKISRKKNNEAFAVVSNPEFLREGTAVEDYFSAPFTIIASTSLEGIKITQQLYNDIDSSIIITDITIAEMMKYICNTFHALKISFANEIGNICKKLAIDSHAVMQLFCSDHKLNLSDYYLKPGFAYGGSCLPKDLKALQTIAHDFYLDCPVIENISKSNDLQKQLVYEKIIGFNKNKIGFLGISFKAGTDDLRYSPIIDIIERLIGKGFEIGVFDRNVQLSKLIGTNREYILDKIPLISQFITDDPAQLINDAEVIVITNKEKEFKTILNQIPEEKIIYDLVNLDFANRSERKNYIGLAW
jgi:GDP-mannose 6-dehydrogenase